MNKLQSNPRLPISTDAKIQALNARLYEVFRAISIAHNDSDMWETSGTAAPTTGTWSQGDKCKNTAPTELGSAGSKYVITGFVCVASGTPGTWVQMRSLTGN